MHQLPFTALLNKLLAGPVTALLTALGIHVEHPQAPIANYVAMQIFVVMVAVMLFIAVRARLSVDNPGFLQHMFEGIHGFISGQSSEVIGHGHATFDSYLTALAIFILFSNLLGLFPTFEAPTAFYYVPLGCALVTWFYYHIHGIRTNGFGYIKHFLGPVWALSPLLFVIEFFSHMARIMSLSIRLFANIFAGDMVTLAFFSLVPIGLPLLFIGLHIGVSFIQTYIFVLLAMVYLSEATAQEH